MKKTSNQYKRVEHAQVIDMFSECLNNLGQKFHVEATRLGKKSTKMGFKFTLHSETKLMGDNVLPCLVVRNSLEGECSLNFRFGLYRFACSNQLCVGKDFFVGRVIHRVGETWEQKIKELEYQIAAFVQMYQGLISEIENTLKKEIEVEKMAQVIDLLKISKKAKAEAKNTIQTRTRDEDKANNVWILWNIANEAIRNTSRTESARENHNDNLLEQIVAYANAA